jgi:hypothetical protein
MERVAVPTLLGGLRVKKSQPISKREKDEALEKERVIEETTSEYLNCMLGGLGRALSKQTL